MFVVRKKLGRGTFFSDVKRVFVDDVRQHHDFLTKFWPFWPFLGDFFHFFGGWEIMII